MEKHKEAVKYLDELEDALLRIEEQRADWKDIRLVVRACHWLFREYVRSENGKRENI